MYITVADLLLMQHASLWSPAGGGAAVGVGGWKLAAPPHRLDLSGSWRRADRLTWLPQLG